MQKIQNIKAQLAPIRKELVAHKVYKSLHTPEDVNTFLEHHIFAVWDFMSLLKALQRNLSCVEVPWVPQGTQQARRFINEIVLEEESDVDEQGNYVSHFELYLQAMKEAGASTTGIDMLIQTLHINQVKDAQSFLKTLEVLPLAKNIKAFLAFTFKVIASNQAHKIAAAFTFGREELIPDMFRGLIGDLSQRFPNKYNTLIYYLDRHIGLDEEEHGPLAEKLILDLCGNDPVKWKECLETAQQALQYRKLLWDSIVEALPVYA